MTSAPSSWESKRPHSIICEKLLTRSELLDKCKKFVHLTLVFLQQNLIDSPALPFVGVDPMIVGITTTRVLYHNFT